MKRAFLLLGLLLINITSCIKVPYASNDLTSNNVSSNSSILSEEEMLEYIRIFFYNQLLGEVKEDSPLFDYKESILLDSPFNLDTVTIYDFYGNYNNAYVLSFLVTPIMPLWHPFFVPILIEDISLWFNAVPLVWHQETFYEFSDSYNVGLLNYNDLLVIKECLESL